MVEKQHFAVLDWLAGVAAMEMVVVVHLFESVYQSHNTNLLMHDALQLIFFFCLSGLLLSIHYCLFILRQNWQIDVLSFLKRRSIRMYPLVILSSFVSLLIYFLDTWDKYSRAWAINLIW
ncbi:hypothetical protein ACFOWA_16020 [Pedobacter lithocola]|uniref:Uncharacterized protein n=1 Tax=Pedobacter lithocola TaxID=1908239 RepID=A0ABV8PFA4_9SPHI